MEGAESKARKAPAAPVKKAAPAAASEEEEAK
jgi:hypothetical protein